jgi:hypothetical protein
MVPDAPWIEVPDDWLDDRLSGHDGYRAFQEYFSVRIKPDVINEYLMGNGILTATGIEMVRFSAQEKAAKLGIERITTMPMTGPEESPERYQFTGAYVWSFYGYSNDNMAGTLNQYIDYLKILRMLHCQKTKKQKY